MLMMPQSLPLESDTRPAPGLRPQPRLQLVQHTPQLPLPAQGRARLILDVLVDTLGLVLLLGIMLCGLLLAASFLPAAG